MFTIPGLTPSTPASAPRTASAALALLLLCVPVAACDDVTAPTVLSTVPADAAIDVAIGGDLAVTFSEAMDPLTLSTATLTLTEGGAPIDGVVAYVGVTGTFNASAPLALETAYTATVTTAATDLAGNPLVERYEWDFATGSTADTTPPSVASTVPLDGAIDAEPDGVITVTFSEAMDPLTIDGAAVLLNRGATSLVGAVTYAGLTATLTPALDLIAGELYTATVTTGATDLAGNPLAVDASWTFATDDATAPTVFSTLPASGELAVPINRTISACFSEAMDPATLDGATFLVTGPGASVVDGVIAVVGSHVTFNPVLDLAPDSLFQATITSGAEDLAGNPLENDYVWSFTKSSDACVGPDPVLLGLAGDYAILAKSGVDSVPASAVTGNVGVSPIDSTAVTGFSLALDASLLFATSSQITGQVRAPDYAAPTPAYLTTAVSSMETAYTDAAGRVLPDFTELGAGEIGGLTLAPGLYKWGTGVSIATDLVLDGGLDDVWIFQIAGDLTQANGTQVTLSGGGVGPERVLAGLRAGRDRHHRALRRCRPLSDRHRAGDRRVGDRPAPGADRRHPGSEHRDRARPVAAGGDGGLKGSVEVGRRLTPSPAVRVQSPARASGPPHAHRTGSAGLLRPSGGPAARVGQVALSPCREGGDRPRAPKTGFTITGSNSSPSAV